jgi:carbonic anhydrase
MMSPELSESSQDTHSSDWDYSGEGAPENWGKLSEEYKLCEIGEMQSPINIDATEFDSEVSIDLNYAVTTFEVVNNGHSIQVNYPTGSTATIGEETYDLLQFHFHTPSEHAIDGEYAEMEVHLVHANEAGEIAVIGSMIEVGDESYDISKIWQNIPAMGESRRSGLVLNPENLIPKSMNHAIYLGSLTTPPCSENVNWIVMAEPITLSQEQIETFQSLYPMDARPIQREKPSYENEMPTEEVMPRWLY